MKLIQAIITLALAVAVAGCRHSQTPQEKISQQTHPNILLYVVDDLGLEESGCYGNPVVKTPGIDKLAESGTRFSHAYCTTPSCSASRSVILTGLYNHANGQYGHSHNEYHFSALPHIISLPVILDSIGYRTLQVGKLHVAPLSVFRFDEYLPANAAPERMADDLRGFISDTTGAPFFLYFCTVEPHLPFRREGSDTINAEQVIVPAHLPDIPQIRDQLARYYMSAQRADRGLLKLIEILQETGQWDNTVILFTSDNGQPFPGAKANLYEPGIHMPLIVRGPEQQRQGIVTDAMVNFADITPTLLDMAGIDPEPIHFHGRSFAGQLSQEKSNGFDTVFASHTFHEIQMYYPMRMVRDRRYKFIWNLAWEQDFPLGVMWDEFLQLVQENSLEMLGKRTVRDYLQRPQYELYDLQHDPDEVHNLAYDSAFSDLAGFYRQRLYDFQLETGDIWSIYQDYEKVRELREKMALRGH